MTCIVAPEVGTVSIVSPTGVIDLVYYSSSSDSDPLEDSLLPVPDFPLIPTAPILPAPSAVVAPSSEYPLAPVVAPSGIRWRRAILIRPALRYTSHHLDHFTSGSSSSYSSSGHSLSEHTPPDTTDADISTPPRFVHRSLARTPLQISPTASVPSPTHVLRSIAPTPADLLPPRKRFRDSYSPEDSGEEHMEVDTADAEAVADVGISEGVVAHPEDGVGMGFEIAASDVREDDEEFEAEASAADTREIVVDPLAIGDSSESSRGGIPDLEDTIYDIVHYMSEVRIDRITEIETTQRQLETSQMVASGERASLVERIGSLRLEYLKVRAMLSIERDRIDSIRWHMALSQEEFRQVRRDRDDTRRRLRRLESYVERHLGFCP
ncbi:hypothetical protein Tco_1055667 [Tanacetum coccineum]|uniref:Uncharacterized protein n=1 Tax=Tanacetum coccineum TaxID=301880 RepID=A0ABQ5H0Y9_9ASTR